MHYNRTKENNTVDGYSRLWALEWAWHPAETNLSCAGNPRICTLNPNILALIVSEISAVIRTDGQTDMARSTRLVILFKKMYTLWGRKRFLLHETYFSTNLVYHFKLTFFCTNIHSGPITHIYLRACLMEHTIYFTELFFHVCSQ